MFIKPIDRDIKGVIKVGQSDEENVKQELEEYVVTREIQKHFADFFANYKKGINHPTDKMGVWISGFFGSGKSHFLKILSYLLENKEVDGKKAMNYFLEDEKITNPMVLADMKLAASIPTDVVLFNIDSKSEMAGKHSKDAIVSVFLKVFNEIQGFSGSNPALADLERQLTDEGKYDQFKADFQSEFGKSWIDSRNKFDFIQDSVVDVLSDMGFMSEVAARNWCEKATEPYQVSIENFAKMVKDYLSHKGRNHHMVFLVDEIGQYIGDDSKLMLNLQTVTEDLGTACQGKVWIVVTSQQDIDSITKTKGNDFSKIQGRFDTRLALSSANVDEVIKKRILDKTPTAEQTLKVLYEQKATIIKNLIVFNDGVEKKLYAGEDDFSLVYPFVPYQFNLLASVLTSIRTHGASGKHLSEGERSMLALFKESAMTLMGQSHGAIVPFNVFYDALHQFLDHSHKGVISRAEDNDSINPDKEENCFNVRVLKTLFMIKYVKEITANVENMTSLMISDIDTDRMVLKKQVEEALKVLTRQMLVQRNGDNYVFLTDEEQEINREIENQNVEMAEIIHKASEIIFEDLFNDKKYRYPEHNGRYHFAFNQTVDDRPYKANQNHDIGVRILTPASEYGDDDATFRMLSGQNNEILMVLPNDSAFLNELRSAIKIEKYLRLTTSNRLAKFEQIKESKRIEMRDRNSNAKLFLQESMKNAKIYVNGDRAQIGNKEVTSRINEALGRLVSTVYHKLSYIEVAMGEANVRALLKSSRQQQFALDGEKEANKNALQDMQSFIALTSSTHAKTSMKSVIDRFMKAPYGFVEDDVKWLVAKLFKTGEVAMTVQGAAVTLLNKPEEDIIRYITKKEFVEKLMLEQRVQPPIHQKKAVRAVMKELYGMSTVSDDDDAIMRSFISYSRDLLNEIEKFELMSANQNLPGRSTLKKGKDLMRSIIHIDEPTEFFKTIQKNQDEYFDFAQDYGQVKSFYKGNQKMIYEETLRLKDIYEDSKTFIVNDEVEECIRGINEILKKSKPYDDIAKLPDLNNRFAEAYDEELSKMAAPILEIIKGAEKRVFEELKTKSYEEEYKDRYRMLFREIYVKAEKSNNVATLQNKKVEADALKMRLLNEMTKKDAELEAEDIERKRKEKEIEDKKRKEEGSNSTEKDNGGHGSKPEPAPKPDPKPVVMARKNISIKSLSSAQSWQINSVEELDHRLRALRAEIMKELDEETIIHLEF